MIKNLVFVILFAAALHLAADFTLTRWPQLLSDSPRPLRPETSENLPVYSPAQARLHGDLLSGSNIMVRGYLHEQGDNAGLLALFASKESALSGTSGYWDQLGVVGRSFALNIGGGSRTNGTKTPCAGHYVEIAGPIDVFFAPRGYDLVDPHWIKTFSDGKYRGEGALCYQKGPDDGPEWLLRDRLAEQEFFQSALDCFECFLWKERLSWIFPFLLVL